MRSLRQKQLLDQEKQYWRQWRRAQRKEAASLLQLLHLRNQISASGPVIKDKPESLEAL